jgi:hypothetical protein
MYHGFQPVNQCDKARVENPVIHMHAVAPPDLHQLAAEIKNPRAAAGVRPRRHSRRPMRPSMANTFANGSTMAGTARWNISRGESSIDSIRPVTSLTQDR